MRLLSMSRDLERDDLGDAQARAIGDAQRRLVLEPGRRLQQARHLLGLRTTGSLRGSRDERQVLDDIGPVERDGEEEPQRRDRAVDGRRAHAARGQMQLKAAQVLGRRRVRRAAEEGCEVLDAADVVVAASSATNLRIVMSSIMRRRSGLMASSVMGCSCLEVRLRTPHPQTGRPVALSCCAAPPAAAPYRASGLVHWHL